MNDNPAEGTQESGTCVIDLDLRPSGEHLPLYYQGDDFLYPETEEIIDDEEHRLVHVGKL